MADKIPIPARRSLFQQAPRRPIPPSVVASETPAGVKEVGTPVMVRMQADLLARLDKARGGLTRPQQVRLILEKALPE